MPILDTVVLFAAADPDDARHRDAFAHLGMIGGKSRVAASSLVEFDLVLRARGFSPDGRREEFKDLVAQFPKIDSATNQIGPGTFYLAASMEEGFRLDYFDSLIAAEALAFDGKLVSSDRDFDAIPGLRRIGLRSDKRP